MLKLDQVALVVSIVAVALSAVIGLSALWESYDRLNRERLARTRIAMLVMTYPFRDELIMLTVVNDGEMAIVGDVVLAVGWFQAAVQHGPINVVILGYSKVVWLHQPFESGEVIRVPERFVREAFKRLLMTLDSERIDNAKKHDARLIAFVNDVEGFRPEGTRTRIRGLLSACDLGIDFEIAARLDLSKPFDVQQMSLRRTRPPLGGGGPAEMQFRIPPPLTTREILLEILEELHEEPRRRRATEK
jgi:hypothetical protein